MVAWRVDKTERLEGKLITFRAPTAWDCYIYRAVDTIVYRYI